MNYLMYTPSHKTTIEDFINEKSDQNKEDQPEGMTLYPKFRILLLQKVFIPKFSDEDLRKSKCDESVENNYWTDIEEITSTLSKTPEEAKKTR